MLGGGIFIIFLKDLLHLSPPLLLRPPPPALPPPGPPLCSVAQHAGQREERVEILAR